MKQEALLAVNDLHVQFAVRAAGSRPWHKAAALKAVNGVSFTLQAGETLGIVGESGCGKSTLARAIIGLAKVHSGRVLWQGQDLTALSSKALRLQRRDIQMIFQDPLASLNPRMTVGDIIAEPLRTFHPELKKADIMRQVQEIMQKVGLLPNQLNRYPHEFSGGQCQRIGIARALVLKPKLLICDEPVSALDVSIQAQVVNLLKQLQREMGLAMIFIAHDLSVVKHIAERVLVMYLGRAVEHGPKEAIFAAPQHPYTQALLAAAPSVNGHKTDLQLKGELPSPLNPPGGCALHQRCPHATTRCAQEEPALREWKGRLVACLRLEEIAA